MNRKATIFILLALCFFIPSTYASMTQPKTIGESYITEDGYVNDAGSKWNDTTAIYLSTTVRGYVEYDISELPDNSTINRLKVRFQCAYDTAEGRGVYITEMQHQPSISSNSLIYDDAGNGTKYITTPDFQTNEIFTVTLINEAAEDLESNLASDWFALGFNDTASDGNLKIITSEHVSKLAPTLIVEYAYTKYNYTFQGLYWENGTWKSSVNVTGHDADGSYEFNVSGSYTVSFDGRPQLFSWPVSTSTRRFYVISDSETFYLFTYEDTYADYEFEIRDFTGQLEPGETWFECYRSVNGTERLTERMVIQETYNKVPITNVYGKTYHIKILWSFGDWFDWGFWVAGIDPTPIIVIREVQFSQQAQITYKYVTVEASRPLGTQINVDYSDSLEQTDWVNLTINDRNGTLVYTENSTLSEKAFTWTEANATHDYVATVRIDHQFFGTSLSASYILDAEGSYDVVPDVMALGTFGGLTTTNIIATTLSIFVFTIFTYQFGGEAGIVSGLAFATSMNALGFADYTYEFLVFLWFVGILGILVGRMR